MGNSQMVAPWGVSRAHSASRITSVQNLGDNNKKSKEITAPRAGLVLVLFRFWSFNQNFFRHNHWNLDVFLFHIVDDFFQDLSRFGG